jgi:hypothetical protein
MLKYNNLIIKRVTNFCFGDYIQARDKYINEPVSSVSIVSEYGLDDLAIEVRKPAEAKVLFL